MGKKWKQWQILFSWAPEPLWTVTASTKLKDACSLEEKLWQIYVLKSRDIILLTEVHTFKAMVFPVVMYRCENWTIKKSECWTDAFKLWCWRRLLRVPWLTRGSNQSILKEINPEYSSEGLRLNLKLIFWLPDEKSWLTGKDIDAGKDWGQEEKGETEDEMVGWLIDSVDIWANWETVKDREAWYVAVHGFTDLDMT